MANDLYPGFVGKSPITGRLRRLETGAQRFQRNTLRPTAGIYTRVPSDVLNRNTSQSLDLTSSHILKRGGVSVSANSAGFAYTATDSSITWYWDGSNGSRVIVIHRADGTNFTIPKSGSGLVVDNLSADTTYYFLPFWSVNNLCNISWVQGTTGSPAIAFVVADTTDVALTPQYLIKQSLQGNEPLTSGFMTAKTATTGNTGGGGGGGGGQPGRCVKAGTEIITLGDLPYSVNVHGESEWVYLRAKSGRDLFCTGNHPLYHPTYGRLTADHFSTGDLIMTDHGEQILEDVQWLTRKCSKWEVVMESGHLFWANGFLSHNAKYSYL